ncbi:hypothetical protein CR513_42942, partial [Mucuna pruriens]
MTAGSSQDNSWGRIIYVNGKFPPNLLGTTFSHEIDETQVPPNFRGVVVEPFDGTQDPHAHLQAFQTQMYISGGDDKLSCKLFSGTLRGVAMQWMTTLSAKTIRTFNDLASAFASQFVANKAKRQAKGESLKNYLARFNNVTVRVNDPNQKFFVKAFQKGLKASPFNDSLVLRRPTSMEEIRMRIEKHMEAEEDQVEWLEEERLQNRKNNGRTIEQRTTHKLDAPKLNYNVGTDILNYNVLTSLITIVKVDLHVQTHAKTISAKEDQKQAEVESISDVQGENCILSGFDFRAEQRAEPDFYLKRTKSRKRSRP